MAYMKKMKILQLDLLIKTTAILLALSFPDIQRNTIACATAFTCPHNYRRISPKTGIHNIIDRYPLPRQRTVPVPITVPVLVVTPPLEVRRRRSSESFQLNFGNFFDFGGNDKNKETEKSEQKFENETKNAANDNINNNDNNDYNDNDPVEKIFNFFFGEKESAPMGMARFGPDRFPEQYLATKDEWALPLDADAPGDIATLRPFLKNTNLENRPLRLTYDANQHGWNAAAFHQKVDKQSPAVVLCVTNKGLICGGYNPKGWVGYGEARGSIAAFLFQVQGPYADTNAPGYKLQKVGGPSFAQNDLPELGPCFGADSLVIPFTEENPKLARSKLG
mmetsp:Transcript_14141/g.20200  ORF Transcript_14141/g.20200 Transcript_14141/m.20200 type:complete len:335 (+) Transcript_14141:38-1042(+)